MDATVSLTTIDLRRITPPQAQFIGELLADVWPRPEVTAADRAARLVERGKAFPDDGPAPRSFAVFEMGRVIAHACVVPRTIGTSIGDMTIAGLALVCTDPRFRGRGLGEVVTRAVLALVDRGEFPLSFFQTTEKVRPFYEKLGCVQTTNRVVNSLAGDPEANPFSDDVMMRYPASAAWPGGTIDLRGPGY